MNTTSKLHILSEPGLNQLASEHRSQAITALENGQVVYLPRYAFSLTELEKPLLDPDILSGKRKNISYDYQKTLLAGYDEAYPLKLVLQNMMHRYADFSYQLVATLFPQYTDDLIWGRTSYRPAQISGRMSSKRKDDTRVHVDAFPATPVNGLRIFRVFCNINPNQEPRVWQVGDTFSNVLTHFSAKLPRYRKINAHLLRLIKATKTLRSAYDHYMLHLHDQMKQDDQYQQTVDKETIDFPPQTTWLVFTDQVSHAALSGQFLLEQTFYLPVKSMQSPTTSPFCHWQRLGFV